MAKSVEQLQKNLQHELDSYRAKHKEYQKIIAKRQQLDALLNENTVVMSELDLLKDDAEVFKLIGPVLIKQELTEAKVNVKKRKDYLQSEIKRLDDAVTALDKKQDSQRETLTNLQRSLQEASIKSAQS